MKIIYFILSLSIFFDNCYSQVSMTYWGGCLNEKFFDVATINNDIYVVGETNSFDTSYYIRDGDVLIFKNEGLNNNSWVKTLRGSIHLDRAIDIEIFNDSTLILTGVYSSKDGAFGTFISRINLNGSIIWSKFFELDNYFPVKAIVTKSNDIILLKFSLEIGYGNSCRGFYHTPTLVKIDNNGNILQSKLFSVSQVPPTDYWGEASDIIPANDSGFILMGNTNIPSYPYILKVDDNLNPIWYKVFKYDNMITNLSYTNANNILNVNDGYIVLGQNYGRTTFWSPCVFKIDFNGNMQWFKEYNDTSIIKNLLIYGNNLYFTSLKNERYWHINCLNLNGNVEWAKELEKEEYYYFREMQGKLISFQDTLYFLTSSSTNEKMNFLSPLDNQWDIEFLKFDTLQNYLKNFKSIELQGSDVNLDTIHCDLHFCEAPISTVNAKLIERNVSFEYDSIQCENLYNIDAINDKEINKSDGLIIYPNPCQGYFNVDGNIEIINQATLRVYGILGNLYISKKFDCLPSQIILENLNKGIYFITIEVNKEFYFSKIVLK